MKAIRAVRFGGPEVLELADVQVPALRAGEALVRLDCAGVNFADAHFREGGRGGIPPVILGVEGAGRVAARAPDVTSVTAGERVAYWTPLPGSYAEYAAVPAWRLVKLPDEIDSASACVMMVQGFTAHYLTHSTFQVGQRHTCLILAAASGVGQMMIRIAKAKGARVIAAVSSDTKAVVARACGADEVILYRDRDFAVDARAMTEGCGVDVVYDSIGAETYQRSIASVGVRGTCVVYGLASGPLPPFDTAILNQAGSIFFTRPNIVHHLLSAAEVNDRAQALFAMQRAGVLKIDAPFQFPLADAAEVHRRLHDREHLGKMILRID